MSYQNEQSKVYIRVNLSHWVVTTNTRQIFTKMFGSSLLLIRAPHLSRGLQFSGKNLSDFYVLISNGQYPWLYGK